MGYKLHIPHYKYTLTLCRKTSAFWLMAQDPYFLSCYYYSAMGRPINPLSRPHVTMINMEKPHTRVSKCFNPAHIAQLSCTKDRWEGTPSWKTLWQMLNFFLTFKFITKGEKKNKTRQKQKKKQKVFHIYSKYISNPFFLSFIETVLFPVNDCPKQFHSPVLSG